MASLPPWEEAPGRDNLGVAPLRGFEPGRGSDGIRPEVQASVRAYVKLLEEYGVTLKHPYYSGVETSEPDHMRELRVQHAGRRYRVLYAFDLRRTAIRLIGGDKTGDDR